MILIHSMMEWIVLGVLSLCLPVWSTVKVTQPYRVVSTNSIAQIQCLIQPQPSNHQRQALDNQRPLYPYPKPEELRVTLLKGLHGKHEVCSSFLSLTEPTATPAFFHPEQKGEVQCSAAAKDGAVEVTVSGLKATDTDIYRCEIHVFFPPPYLRYTGNGTLIHVLDGAGCPVRGAQRQNSHQGGEGEEKEEGDETSEPVSVPVVGLVIAITCVLAIIIYFQTLQCLGGRREIFRAVPSVHHKMDLVSLPRENIV